MPRVFTLVSSSSERLAGRMAVGINKPGRNETFPRVTSISQIAECLNPLTYQRACGAPKVSAIRAPRIPIGFGLSVVVSNAV